MPGWGGGEKCVIDSLEANDCHFLVLPSTDTMIKLPFVCIWICSYSITCTAESSSSSPWTYKQTFMHVFIYKLELKCYRWNYVPTNQENFSYSQTLTHTNKNDPQYLEFYVHMLYIPGSKKLIWLNCMKTMLTNDLFSKRSC